MHKSHRLRALAVVPFAALGLLAQSGGQTFQVAAHSSRWDYPKEAIPGPGQELHVVEKGDTLWDLGTKYLGNPFAWPQIWELNKWVKDPHWIYPGDPLLVESSRGTVPTSENGGKNLAPTDVANLQPDLRSQRKPVLDEYAFTFQDFVQMPYLVPGTGEAYFKQIGAFKLVGKQDSSRDLLGDGDSLYIGGGSDQGVKPGDRLVVTRVVVHKLYHPDDLRHVKPLGDVVEQFGIIRVTHVYPNESVAIIEKSLDGISSDGYAAPYVEPVAIVNQLRTDITSPITVKPPVAKIIFIRMNKAVASSGDLVIIDRGTADGFKVGDVLLSARSEPLDRDQKGPKRDMTNYYLGQSIVIKNGEHASTCRILRSTEEVMVGDILTH